MNCNIELHFALKESGEILCSFCDVKLQDCPVTYDLCCDKEEKIIDNGMRVCRYCGVVQGFDLVNDWVDFYENMYKIRRKSIYHRKCHIENVIMDICTADRIEITRDEINRICKIFDEIGKILHQLNDGRKRMISSKFILMQVFKRMNLPYKNIPISKSKRTLASYKQYWKKIILLIGNEIQSIIG